MDEILKRDQNFVTVLAGITDDAAQNIRMFRVDPTTGRLILSISGVSVAATVDVGTTTTTGPGTSATAVNVGTTSAAIINFTIPRGSIIYSTVTIPDNAVGLNGDWAFSTAVDSEVYYKSGGAWALVNSVRGEQGIPGPTGPVGMTWKGAWVNFPTVYAKDDAVSYLGSSYISKSDGNDGNLPTDTIWWDLLALKGTDGAGAGDVMGPATNTDSYIPQWNGADSKTLKNGLAVPAGGLAGLTEVGGKQEYHGVESYAGLAFSNANKTLTLSAITYWYKGVQYITASTVTCDLDLTTDRDNSSNTLTANTLYFFYFKDTTGKLYWSDTPWNFRENVFVATVFWNNTAGAVQDECHNHTRNLDWHIWAHDTIGTRYESGLDKTAPTTSADNTIDITTGVIDDEDMEFTTGRQQVMRGWRKISASQYTFDDYALPYLGANNDPKFVDIDAGAGYVLTSVADSDYACYWVYATFDIDRPIYIIPTTANAAYNTITTARLETPPNNLNLGVNAEMKLIYRFIYRGDGQFQESTDYRTSSPVPGGGVSTVAAGSVSFNPSGAISASNVQNALEEVDAEKIPYTGATGAVDLGANNLTVDTNTLIVDAVNDRIGIGIIPESKVHIATVGANTYLTFDAYQNITGTELGFKFRKSNSLTLGTKTATLTGTTLGILSFQGVNTGSVFDTGADITIIQNGDATASTVPADIVFRTWGDSVVNANQLVLHHDGGVGIGTIPTAVFHLKAGTATAGTAPLKFTSGTLNTTPEAGTIEFDGTNFYLTI